MEGERAVVKRHGVKQIERPLQQQVIFSNDMGHEQSFARTSGEEARTTSVNRLALSQPEIATFLLISEGIGRGHAAYMRLRVRGGAEVTSRSAGHPFFSRSHDMSQAISRARLAA